MFHHIIGQGVLTAGLISAVLGIKLPGPGTIYLGQDLQFLAPVESGRYYHSDGHGDFEDSGPARRDT